jgi:hypothetical protein
MAMTFEQKLAVWRQLVDTNPAAAPQPALF